MGSKGSRTYLKILLGFIMLLIAFFPYSGIGVVKTYARSEADNINFLSTVHFIDVGQGDCTFIELPNSRTCIIDGGSSVYSSQVVKYIQNLGYSKIDLMIATHSDADHVGGLSAVLSNFEVKRILRPYVLSRGGLLEAPDELESVYNYDKDIIIDSDESYSAFINLAYKETYDNELSEIEVISNRTLFPEFENVDENVYVGFEIISPVALEEEYLSDASLRTRGYKSAYSIDSDRMNTGSAVVLYTIGNNAGRRRFLFTADATETTEKEILNMCAENELLRERLQDIDCLKVAHHGSKYSSTAEFLDLVRPHSAVISVGIDNEYGHPDSGTIDRLRNYVASENLFRTDISGSIKIKFGNDGNIWVETNKINVNDPIPNWVLYLVLGLVLLSIVAITVINLIQRRLEKKLKSEQTEDNLENVAGTYEESDTEAGDVDINKNSTYSDCEIYETQSGQITLLNPDEINDKKKRRKKN